MALAADGGGRGSGDQEPLELFVVGTARLSTKAAEDVARAVQVRAPCGLHRFRQAGR
jgi:hypothetical protein